MANQAQTNIIAILTPYFGDKMAEGMVEMSSKSLHVDAGGLTAAQLGLLAKDIEKRMAIFVGADKAAAVAKAIADVKI